MQALKQLVGSSQILFGTDFPFVPVELGLSGLQTAGFSPEELRAICFDNASRILPRIGRARGRGCGSARQSDNIAV